MVKLPLLALAAVVLALLLLGSSPVSPVAAAETPEGAYAPAGGIEDQHAWGGVACNADLQALNISLGDIVLMLTTIALVTQVVFPGIGCPLIGSQVNVQGHGPAIWGDNDCSGGPIDGFDVLLLMLYIAGITQIVSGCPELGAAIILVAFVADLKYGSLSHTVPEVYATGGGAVPQHFQGMPVRTRFTALMHNNGPVAASTNGNAVPAHANWTADLSQGTEDFFYWVAEDADDVCYLDDVAVSCQEGDPEDGDGIPNCLDGDDNDADQLVDANDPDCPQYMDEIEFHVSLSPSVQASATREIIVGCGTPGPFTYEVTATLTPEDADDPEPANNTISDTVGEGPDPANCVAP